MTPILTDAQVAEAIGRLLTAYVRVVDGGDLDRWPPLFAREASYTVVPRENEARGLPLALVCDDTRARIEDRVTFIKEFWAGNYNRYWPRHVVSLPHVERVDEAEYAVEQNFAVYITEPGAIGSSLLVVGQYQDRIVFEDGAPRFRARRVLVDTAVLPRYFVYPL